jgi:hypothetical protein
MSLTTFLQEAFVEEVRDGWQCFAERKLLEPGLAKELGFSPRVDVLLENGCSDKRIWIEFEVSRADPAANHVKYAVGHFFSPDVSKDIFLSMVSNHVTRGRANLGATTVMLMRHLGIRAFQTPLLPRCPAAQIKQLNHLTHDELQSQSINVAEEIRRAFTVTAPAFNLKSDEVYYAGNEFEVSLNAKQWNTDICSADNAAVWGRRTVKYFVYDRQSKTFAPCKFCAFLPILRCGVARSSHSTPLSSVMTVANYCALDQSALKFDGSNAQLHLRKRLGFDAWELPQFAAKGKFMSWLGHHSAYVRTHRDGPVILMATR